MFAAIVASVLCAGPFEARSAPVSVTVTQQRASGLRVKLSAGGLLGSAWFVPTFRQNVLRLESQALGPHSLELETLTSSTPILGPLLLANRAPLEGDRPWLCLSAGLQAAGLAVLALQLANGAETQDAGPELSFSPIVAGRFGVAVTLTGF